MSETEKTERELGQPLEGLLAVDTFPRPSEEEVRCPQSKEPLSFLNSVPALPTSIPQSNGDTPYLLTKTSHAGRPSVGDHRKEERRRPATPADAAVVPKLTKEGYSTRPSLEALREYSEMELAKVQDFAVVHQKYGEVEWPGFTDVRGLDLDTIVTIENLAVECYGEEYEETYGKTPEEGTGLNRRAIITLFNCKPLEMKNLAHAELTSAFPKIFEKHVKKMKNYTTKLGAKFINLSENWTWKFEVEHFSRYQFIQESTEEESGESRIQKVKTTKSEEMNEDVIMRSVSTTDNTPPAEPPLSDRFLSSRRIEDRQYDDARRYLASLQTVKTNTPHLPAPRSVKRRRQNFLRDPLLSRLRNRRPLLLSSSLRLFHDVPSKECTTKVVVQALSSTTVLSTADPPAVSSDYVSEVLKNFLDWEMPSDGRKLRGQKEAVDRILDLQRDSAAIYLETSARGAPSSLCPQTRHVRYVEETWTLLHALIHSRTPPGTRSQLHRPEDMRSVLSPEQAASLSARLVAINIGNWLFRVNRRTVLLNFTKSPDTSSENDKCDYSAPSKALHFLTAAMTKEAAQCLYPCANPGDPMIKKLPQYPRLALCLLGGASAIIGGHPERREHFQRQLRKWKETNLLGRVPDGVLALYRILAGNLEGDSVLSHCWDWRQGLSLFYFFSPSEMVQQNPLCDEDEKESRMTLAECLPWVKEHTFRPVLRSLRQFRRAVEAYYECDDSFAVSLKDNANNKNCPKFLPLSSSSMSCEDLQFNLLMMLCGEITVDFSYLSTNSHTARVFDFSLIWPIQRLLLKLFESCSTSTLPLVKLRQQMTLTDLGFIEQLQDCGLWHWIVYVLLTNATFSEDEKEKRIHDALSTSAPSRCLFKDPKKVVVESAKWRFCAERLGIPVLWIFQAFAQRLEYERQFFKAAEMNIEATYCSPVQEDSTANQPYGDVAPYGRYSIPSPAGDLDEEEFQTPREHSPELGLGPKIFAHYLPSRLNAAVLDQPERIGFHRNALRQLLQTEILPSTTVALANQLMTPHWVDGLEEALEDGRKEINLRDAIGLSINTFRQIMASMVSFTGQVDSDEAFMEEELLDEMVSAIKGSKNRDFETAASGTRSGMPLQVRYLRAMNVLESFRGAYDWLAPHELLASGADILIDYILWLRLLLVVVMTEDEGSPLELLEDDFALIRTEGFTLEDVVVEAHRLSLRAKGRKFGLCQKVNLRGVHEASPEAVEEIVYSLSEFLSVAGLSTL